jgi:hypothetical protein
VSAVVVTGTGRELGTTGFRAPRRSRIWAKLATAYIIGMGSLLFTRSLRPEAIAVMGEAAAAIGMMLPLVALSLGLLALAVRSARLRIDEDGVHWGWGTIGFTMAAAKIRTVRVHKDAIALVPKRGFPWYLAARDWQPFPDVARAFSGKGMSVERHEGRAPLAARLQGYGSFLDLLLVLAVLLVTFPMV